MSGFWNDCDNGKDDSATVQGISRMLQGEIIPLYSNIITKEYRELLDILWQKHRDKQAD